MNLHKRFDLAKRSFIVLFFFTLFLGIFLILFSKPQFPNISPDEIASPLPSEYTITPTQASELSPLIPKRNELFFSVSPKQYFRYLITQGREWYNRTVSKKYNPLFFAEKRIMEANRFSSDFIFLDRKNTLDSFINYHTRSWQHLINRYKSVVNEYIHTDYKNLKKSSKREFFELLSDHETRLIKTIFSSYLPQHQKIKLSRDVFRVFSNFWMNIEKDLKDAFSPNIVYELDEIIQNHDWGSYEATFEYDTEYTSSTQLLIDSNNTHYHMVKDPVFVSHGLREKEKNTDDTSVVLFADVLSLVPSTPYEMYVEIPESVSLLSANWYQTKTLSVYFQNLPSVQLVRITPDKKEEIVASAPVYLLRNIPRVLTYAPPEKDIARYELRITSPLIFLPFLKNATLRVFDARQPEISLVKKQDLTHEKTLAINRRNPRQVYIVSSNIPKNELLYIAELLPWGWRGEAMKENGPFSFSQTFVYAPFSVLKSITILSIFLLFSIGLYIVLHIKNQKNACFIDYIFSKPLYKKIFKRITLPFIILLYAIYRFSTQFKTYLFIFSLFGFIFDIYFFDQNSDALTTLFTLTWVMAMAGYRAESRNSFATAIIFLVFCPVLLIFKQDFMAEKSAIWAYMLLVVGTIQAIIELKNPLLVTEPFPEFYKKRAAYITSVFIEFYQRLPLKTAYHTALDTLKLSYQKVKHVIFLFLGKLPQSPQEWALYAGKIIALIALSTSFFIFMIVFSRFISIKVSDLAVQYRDYRAWESLKPRVYEIEPKIIYPGMKVILRGKNFGWREMNGYRIITDQLPYVDLPDVWTDTKIIFTVPLSWNPTAHYIFIQKPVLWKGKYVNSVSDGVKLTVIPRTNMFNRQDDIFFEELKRVSDEARKINGYN